MDETMILKGLPFLCIFGNPYALGKSSSVVNISCMYM